MSRHCGAFVTCTGLGSKRTYYLLSFNSQASRQIQLGENIVDNLTVVLLLQWFFKPIQDTIKYKITTLAQWNSH